ncbi:MAG: radical SAM protein [Planctomycetes bacterium]|nr:radical SAM protein [Planctomycetota bacterium]
MIPPQEFMSDEVVVQTTADGSRRYFRADDPDREEFTYRKPFILELELTRRCNLRCLHCYAHAQDRAFTGELTFDEICCVLDDGRELGIRELSLTGGEVFLHAELFPLIDAGIERGYAVRFVTNATLVDDQAVQALSTRPIKLITVSLDAINPAVHERIRGVPGSHAAAVAGIERLAAAGFKISVITAFSAVNVDEFDDLFSFCAQRGIDWQVQITSAKGRCPRDVTLSPDGYYALGEKVAGVLADAPSINIIPMDDLATFSNFGPLNLLSQTWQGQCTGGLLNLFLRANGDVTPCSALAFPECVVGNVRTESLRTICQQERCQRNLAWLTPAALTGVCADCPFQGRCRGGCPEILISMCARRTENEYCYHRIEQERILDELIHA